MKVFITGGAGFLGSTLADRLLARGEEVMVIDNFSTGRRDNLKPHPKLTLIEGSIVDGEKLKKLVAEFNPSVIVHAAASYKDPTNWVEDTYTNVLGTVNVIQAAKAAGVNRLVYLQTALCYGLNPKEQPIQITHHIDSANSSYAISKTAAEQYIQISGLNYASFRLANAYGPRNISGPLPTFYHRLTQNKPCFVMDTRRDFIYVEDLVDVLEKAVDGIGQGEYHISSGSDYSIKELFDATIDALGIKLEKDVEVRDRNPDDAFTILLSPEKTNKDFDWKVKTPLNAGVKNTIEYYKEFGIEQTFTHLKQVEEKA